MEGLECVEVAGVDDSGDGADVSAIQAVQGYESVADAERQRCWDSEVLCGAEKKKMSLSLAEVLFWL